MDTPTRLAYRWLTRLGRASPHRILEDALAGPEPDLTKIKTGLEGVLNLLGVVEVQAELGYRRSIEAEWFYALGPRLRNRALQVLKTVVELQRLSDQSLRSNPERVKNFLPEVVWLESMAKAQGDGGEALGPFTVHVMPGVSRKDIDEAKEALLEASAFLTKHFPQVVYGKVFFSPRVSSGLAQYVPAKDTIFVGMKAKKTVGDVHAICHEFGHRYFTRFWRDTEARNRFRQLTQDTEYERVVLSPAEHEKMVKDYLKAVQAAKAGKKAPMSKSTEEYIILISKQDPVGFGVLRTVATQFFQGDIALEDLARKFREVSPTSWDTDKVLREPLFITPYARSKPEKWDENFAEAFAHFVMSKPLPREIQDIMEGLR